jgi:hypothetical protein
MKQQICNEQYKWSKQGRQYVPLSNLYYLDVYVYITTPNYTLEHLSSAENIFFLFRAENWSEGVTSKKWWQQLAKSPIQSIQLKLHLHDSQIHAWTENFDKFSLLEDTSLPALGYSNTGFNQSITLTNHKIL